MRKKRGPRQRADATTLTPHPWPGLPVLRTVRLLNQRCITILADVVHETALASGSPAMEVLHEFRAELNARACERAGRCPTLLVTLNFDRPDWWDCAGHPTQKSMPPDLQCVLFTQETAVPLLREILVEAWSLGRTMPRATGLLFGMAPGVTKAIARLSIQEIDHLVANYAQFLRPRWAQYPTFWRGLIRAAMGSDDGALINAQLHCLSLLGGERLRPGNVGSRGPFPPIPQNIFKRFRGSGRPGD